MDKLVQTLYAVSKTFGRIFRVVKGKVGRRIMKAKKKKRKNGFKKFVRTVLFTIVLCVGAVGGLLYNRLFFKGEVKDKYQSDNPKRNRILVKTWFGEKDFCVDEETYTNVKVGDNYSFKKETTVDWVKLQDKQKKDTEEQVEEVTDKKTATEEFKFI